MYGSHDMRHTGFRKLTVVIGTPGFWGVTIKLHMSLPFKSLSALLHKLDIMDSFLNFIKVMD